MHYSSMIATLTISLFGAVAETALPEGRHSADSFVFGAVIAK